MYSEAMRTGILGYIEIADLNYAEMWVLFLLLRLTYKQQIRG
jgi:hypothetical protein